MSAVLTSGCRCVPRFTHKKLAYNLRAEAFYISELRSGYLAYTYVDYCLTSSGVGNTSGVNEWLSVRPALHSQRFVYHFGRKLLYFGTALRSQCLHEWRARSGAFGRGQQQWCKRLAVGASRDSLAKICLLFRAEAFYITNCAPATFLVHIVLVVLHLWVVVMPAVCANGCRCVPRFT